MSSLQIFDHQGAPVRHGKAKVNDVRLHYMTAGTGAPLLLLHGVPKTSTYWYRIFPLLTSHFTLIAPDIRGFGDSEKPIGGYDMATIATDLAELMTSLGHDTFFVAGEDWGAAFAYAVAATNRQRVKKLSYGEMLLPGFGIEKWSFLNKENVESVHWSWHVAFFFLREIPEMLIRGKEEIFWTSWMKNETYDPSAISNVAAADWIRSASGPGGLRGIFEVYRAHFVNQELVLGWSKDKLTIPVLALSSAYFMGDEPLRQMENVAADIRFVELEHCGHSMALEQPQRVAEELINFFASSHSDY
ncbi:alpha/beta fold hydrolase [Komagataeibacter europaeus]|uniref:alpha/beta fold hydrolase n=1 Tax=Komagataeibacter europaeus TaxID=33995 RepID=UPI000B3E5AF9|nr:alpha/beta hydrolase [Komagataeibacter europaeus]ARW15978.1 Haloacetate dehalogenase [Komagataeibacter europaeus]